MTKFTDTRNSNSTFPGRESKTGPPAFICLGSKICRYMRLFGPYYEQLRAARNTFYSIFPYLLISIFLNKFRGLPNYLI